MTGEANQNWQAYQRQIILWPHQRSGIVVPLSAGRFRRAWAWSALGGGQNLRFYFILAPLLVLCQLLIGHFVNQPNPGAKTEQIYLGALAWTTLLPALMIPESWLRHWRFAETELLRPAKRADFLADLGLAMAINVMQGWLIFGAAVIVYILLTDPWTTLWGQVAMSLGESLLLGVFFFAVGVWLMRYRKQGLMGVVNPIVMVLAVVATVAGFHVHADWVQRAVLPASAGLAIVGVGITRDAYRRWVGTELG
jgi:hypothetical protein